MIFFICAHIQIFFFFSSSLLNYPFPYCIQLYTWSTQQVIVAQHMCWFLKASNPPMFRPINYLKSLWIWTSVTLLYSLLDSCPWERYETAYIPQPCTNTVIQQRWCNGYCRRKWTRQHEFKSWTRLIAIHIALISLGKV